MINQPQFTVYAMGLDERQWRDGHTTMPCSVLCSTAAAYPIIEVDTISSSDYIIDRYDRVDSVFSLV